MSVSSLARRFLDTYDGFNPPATAEALERLRQSFGPLPEDVFELYRAFDGSADGPRRGERRLFSRLMPIAEVIEQARVLDWLKEDWPTPGAIAWLWFDDNGNYVGVYTDGPLRGWLLIFDPHAASAAPAWRSVESFLVRQLDSAVGTATGDDEACDLPMVPQELPLLAESPEHTAADSALARACTEQYERTDAKEADRRRLYALCAMTLTPPSETASITRFLADDDMWTPESAAWLMCRRKFEGAVPELEALVNRGRSNGAGAAAQCLASLSSAAARDAIERLARHPDEDLRSQVQQAIDTVKFRAARLANKS